MKLYSDSFNDGAAIPGEFAFAVAGSDEPIALSSNRNPHLRWEDVPAGTQSLLLVCHDPDVPSRADDVNQAGRSVSRDLPRIDFAHWILHGIPAAAGEIAAGSHSSAITAGGKPAASLPAGFEHGINDYTLWFSGDAQMAGSYFGYDGPCPPWNDELMHRYIFTLYALDVPALAIEGEPVLANVKAALGKVGVLAEASLTGLYTLNPAL